MADLEVPRYPESYVAALKAENGRSLRIEAEQRQLLRGKDEFIERQRALLVERYAEINRLSALLKECRCGR